MRKPSEALPGQVFEVVVERRQKAKGLHTLVENTVAIVLFCFFVVNRIILFHCHTAKSRECSLAGRSGAAKERARETERSE